MLKSTYTVTKGQNIVIIKMSHKMYPKYFSNFSLIWVCSNPDINFGISSHTCNKLHKVDFFSKTQTLKNKLWRMQIPEIEF